MLRGQKNIKLLTELYFDCSRDVFCEVGFKFGNIILEWGGERGAQGSGGETWGKETIVETQTQMGG